VVEPAGTRGRGRRCGRGRGDVRLVSAVDAVAGRWGGAAAVDEAAGTAEGSPPWLGRFPIHVHPIFLTISTFIHIFCCMSHGTLEKYLNN
jgi:hypothetical protein